MYSILAENEIIVLSLRYSWDRNSKVNIKMILSIKWNIKLLEKFIYSILAQNEIVVPALRYFWNRKKNKIMSKRFYFIFLNDKIERTLVRVQASDAGQ